MCHRAGHGNIPTRLRKSLILRVPPAADFTTVLLVDAIQLAGSAKQLTLVSTSKMSSIPDWDSADSGLNGHTEASPSSRTLPQGPCYIGRNFYYLRLALVKGRETSMAIFLPFSESSAGFHFC